MENVFNRRHFSLANLRPTISNPILFVVSQWQLNKSQPGTFYLIYRSIPATFFVTTWLMKLGVPSWATHLSMWGYTLCTLQALMAFLLSLATVVTMTVFERVDLGRKVLKTYPIYWLVNVTATTVGFAISIVHWSVLLEGKGFTVMDFFIHGVNAIYLFIDLCLAAQPVRFIHVVYPLLFGTAYLIFGIFYHSYDKNRGGSGYVYPIINWDYPVRTSFVVLGIGFLVVLFHLLTFVTYLIKIWIYNKYRLRNNGNSDSRFVQPETR